MGKQINSIFLLPLILTLAGCSTLQRTTPPSTPSMATPSLTPTHVPTATSTPTATLTATPPISPTPTDTPTPELPVGLGTPLPQPLQVIGPENVSKLRLIGQVGDGIFYDAILSADGERLLAAFSTGPRIYDLDNLQQIKSCSIPIPEMLATMWGGGIRVDGFAHAFSPDGDFFAVLAEQEVHLWRVSDCSLIYVLELDVEFEAWDYDPYELEIIFSPDSHYFAFAKKHPSNTRPMLIWLWRVSDGALLVKEYGEAMAFSPDGTIFATSAAINSQAKLWSTDDGSLIRTLNGQRDLKSLAFSPDGAILAACYYKSVWLWDIAEGKSFEQIYGKNGYYFCNLSFTKDGQYLSVRSEDTKIWSIKEHKLIVAQDWAPSVISSDGSTLISFYNSEVPTRLWRRSDGKMLAEVYGSEHVFSPDGSHVAFGGDNLAETFLVRLTDGEMVLLEGANPIFSFDSKCLFTFSLDKINRWNLPGGELSKSILFSELENLHGVVSQLKFSIDGKYLAALRFNASDSSVYGGRLIFTRVNDLSIDKQYWGFTGYNNFDLSSDGYLFAVVWESTVELTRIENGEPIRVIEAAPLYGKMQITLSLDSSLLAVADGNPVISIWNIEDGNLVSTLSSGGELPVTHLAFSPNGSQLYATTYKGKGKESLEIWEISSGTKLRTEPYVAIAKIPGGSTGCINRPFVISPDTSLLAMSGPECTINLIRISDWKVMHTLDVGIGRNGVMAFSPNGNLLATAFQGGEVRLWDVTEGKIVQTIVDHENPVEGYPTVTLAFSHDGRLLATAGMGVINLWGIWP